MVRPSAAADRQHAAREQVRPGDERAEVDAQGRGGWHRARRARCDPGPGGLIHDQRGGGGVAGRGRRVIPSGPAAHQAGQASCSCDTVWIAVVRRAPVIQDDQDSARRCRPDDRHISLDPAGGVAGPEYPGHPRLVSGSRRDRCNSAMLLLEVGPSTNRAVGDRMPGAKPAAGGFGGLPRPCLAGNDPTKDTPESESARGSAARRARDARSTPAARPAARRRWRQGGAPPVRPVVRARHCRARTCAATGQNAPAENGHHRRYQRHRDHHADEHREYQGRPERPEQQRLGDHQRRGAGRDRQTRDQHDVPAPSPWRAAPASSRSGSPCELTTQGSEEEHGVVGDHAQQQGDDHRLQLAGRRDPEQLATPPDSRRVSTYATPVVSHADDRRRDRGPEGEPRR